MQPRTMFYALFHWFNLLFVAGVATAAIYAGDSRVLFLGVALELLWLIGGARSPFFQRYAALRNGQIEQKAKALRSLEGQQKLSYEYKQRYRNLEKTKIAVLDAAKANSRLDTGAIAPELEKIDMLMESFIRIAVAHKKLTTYLTQTTAAQLQAEVDNANAALADPHNAAAALRTSLQDQLSLAQKRFAEHDKIVQTEKTLGVQLETIEKTLAFLQTKIVSMQRPSEFGQEIESVVMGVEAAERTLAATDQIDEEMRALKRRVTA